MMRANLGGVLFALLAAEITRDIYVSSLKLQCSTILPTTLPLSGSSTARTRIRLRALHFS